MAIWDQLLLFASIPEPCVPSCHLALGFFQSSAPSYNCNYIKASFFLSNVHFIHNINSESNRDLSFLILIAPTIRYILLQCIIATRDSSLNKASQKHLGGCCIPGSSQKNLYNGCIELHCILWDVYLHLGMYSKMETLAIADAQSEHKSQAEHKVLE